MRQIRACGGMAASCVVLFASGCLDRQLAPLSPCLVTSVSETISVTNVDSVDVLFMIDNSISMADEQAALVRELPKLVRVLSSGDRDGNGIQDFKPVELRLGVVSSDLGLPGIGAPCSNGLGDNAVLQHMPPVDSPLNCQASYPSPFLSFTPQTGPNAQAEVDRISNDFACISTLGTSGCGFEQQLEATLKALWPSDNLVQGQDMRAALGQFPTFVADPNTQQGGNGNGDPFGANAGFLRNDASKGLSLIAVVLVTDEEDCSSWNLSHLRPDNMLGPDDELRQQPPNLRCFRNKQNLYAVQRYVEGLKALRPGQEDLVVFAAITGVLPALVDEAALSRVDFNDAAQSDAFYDAILNHSSMVERPNESGLNLETSCTATVNGVEQKAYPPRRIVEVAKGFGKNGIVQSICNESFAPAMNRIIETIVQNVGDVCLPRKLVRDINGEVACRVVWDLPKVSNIAPTFCEDTRYAGVLSRPMSGRKTETDDGRAICDVTQLPIGPCAPRGGENDPCATGLGPLGDNGWFYDDFSFESQMCNAIDKQRIAFTTTAQPPTGVVVRLECTNEVQSLANVRNDVLNPADAATIGDECQEHSDCAVALNDPRLCQSGRTFYQAINGTCFDTGMFCHESEKRCVKACRSAGDCPDAWQCDVDGVINPLIETSNQPICVNPTCGD